ncbi:hypothetical protein AB3G45_24995 [Shinella sp. S4-D37]|uniref:hypothetical protein n=1 Tax=Shinella sp. S4-D37 TaxID=3161999 RepID=UPI0034674343
MDVRARLRRMIKNEETILDLQHNGIRDGGTEKTLRCENDATAEARRRIAMYEMLLADLDKRRGDPP